MRILVTGAGGMLGSALVPELKSTGNDVLMTDIIPGYAQLDVRDPAALDQAVGDYVPDAVVHLAAETDLEACERDPAHCHATNATGAANAARVCGARDLLLVYISTAGVFDGTKPGPYVETDEANPVNEYGRAKLAGEKAVLTACPRSLVVRAGWMFGGGALDHKFVGLVLGQIAAGKQTIHAVGDKSGSPTYTVDFARSLGDLMHSGHLGLYHVVCAGRPSRYDVARRILDRLGRSDVSLEKVDSGFFAGEYFAARPPSEWMATTALDHIGLNSMRHWTEALDEYLERQFPEMVVRR